MSNNGWEEQGEAVTHRSSHEKHDEGHDEVRGSDGLQDFFETESLNRFDGWSIIFQAPHDDTEDPRVKTCRQVIYKIGRLALSGVPLKTWIHLVLKAQ